MMTAADFTAWVEKARATRAWSGRRCAIELGCDKNRIGEWRLKGAPKYIALACAALDAGLPPFTAVNS